MDPKRKSVDSLREEAFRLIEKNDHINALTIYNEYLSRLNEQHTAELLKHSSPPRGLALRPFFEISPELKKKYDLIYSNDLSSSHEFFYLADFVADSFSNGDFKSCKDILAEVELALQGNNLDFKNILITKFFDFLWQECLAREISIKAITVYFGAYSMQCFEAINKIKAYKKPAK